MVGTVEQVVSEFVRERDAQHPQQNRIACHWRFRRERLAVARRVAREQFRASEPQMNVWSGVSRCEERIADGDRPAVARTPHRPSREDHRDRVGAGPGFDTDAVWCPDAVGDLEYVGEHGLAQARLVKHPDMNDPRAGIVTALGARPTCDGSLIQDTRRRHCW